jgi:mono/diheme cytochrome c family protein
MKRILLILAIISLVFLQGCRGWRSEKPPIHLNPNMDFQAKYKAQALSQPIPDNTVAWGSKHAFVDETERLKIEQPKDQNAYFKGIESDGSFVKKIPSSIIVSHELLKRGQERFNIYCAPCHGQDGSGNGSVTSRGWFKPANFSNERVVAYADGRIFDIMTNGYNTMPSYKEQLSETDRWAIVAYIRALQKTQLSTINDVPEEDRLQIRE